MKLRSLTKQKGSFAVSTNKWKRDFAPDSPYTKSDSEKPPRKDAFQNKTSSSMDVIQLIYPSLNLSLCLRKDNSRCASELWGKMQVRIQERSSSFLFLFWKMKTCVLIYKLQVKHAGVNGFFSVRFFSTLASMCKYNQISKKKIENRTEWWCSHHLLVMKGHGEIRNTDLSNRAQPWQVRKQPWILLESKNHFCFDLKWCDLQ